MMCVARSRHCCYKTHLTHQPGADSFTMQMPLPLQAVLGSGKPQGKAHTPELCSSINPARVDMYALMTYKPLTPDGTGRCHQGAWNDAPHQPRKKAVANAAAAAAGAHSLQQLLAAQAPQPMRFVPYGGIAQEQGMTLDAIVANRKHFKR